MRVCTDYPYRLRKRCLATIVTVLAPHHPLEAAATHLLMATTIVGHLRVPTALVVKITVVAPHLLVTSTTPVIAAIAPHLLAPLVHLSMILIHHLLVALMVVRIPTVDLLVAAMMTRMLPMGTMDVGRDHHHPGAIPNMKGVLLHVTGDYSSHFFGGVFRMGNTAYDDRILPPSPAIIDSTRQVGSGRRKANCAIVLLNFLRRHTLLEGRTISCNQKLVRVAEVGD
jgi:hypothetical protein